MNATLNTSSTDITAQSNARDSVSKFLARKPPGIGREHGRVAVEMYTEVKSVCILV